MVEEDAAKIVCGRIYNEDEDEDTTWELSNVVATAGSLGDNSVRAVATVTAAVANM